MTLEEYKKALTKLEKAYKDGKKHADALYVASNNPYRKGDVVGDKLGMIRISRIDVAYDKSDDNLPKAVYVGKALDLWGKPVEPVTVRKIWQPELI